MVTTGGRIEQVNAAERLRQVDAAIAARLRQRSHPDRDVEVEAVEQPAPSIVPEPRGVRVFLRGPGDHGEFARLTVIHPVLPRPRVRRYT